MEDQDENIIVPMTEKFKIDLFKDDDLSTQNNSIGIRTDTVKEQDTHN